MTFIFVKFLSLSSFLRKIFSIVPIQLEIRHLIRSASRSRFLFDFFHVYVCFISICIFLVFCFHLQRKFKINFHSRAGFSLFLVLKLALFIVWSILVGNRFSLWIKFSFISIKKNVNSKTNEILTVDLIELEKILYEDKLFLPIWYKCKNGKLFSKFL